MIKYDLKNINDWNFGGSNVTKVYRNGAMVYYKVSGEGPTPEYQVCFAVVDDISQYSDREYEDVYDKATDKWYKLNNLNQYEEYGIYGSGRTSCEGSASRLPQGYTEVEYIENTSTAYIDTGAYLNTSNFEIGYTIENKQQLFGYVHQGCGSCTWLGVEQSATMWWGNFNNKASISSYLTSSENTIIFTQSGATINGNNISKTLRIGSDSITNIPLMIFARYNFNGNTIEHRTDSYMKLKSFYLKNNGTLVRDFVPAKRNSDGKYGLYDIVNNVFYLSPNNVDFSGGEPITPTDCVTTYNGKLTIDDETSSRVPQGYSEVEYIENTSTAYINTEVLLYDSATNSYEIETKMSSTWGGGEFEYLLATEGTSNPYNGLELRWNTHYQSGGELQCESVPKNVTYSNIDNGDGTSAITISCTSTNATNDVPLSLFCGIWSSGPWRNGKGKIYDLKITKNNVLVRDLVPTKRDSDGKYGLYDIVNDVFYLSPNNIDFSGGEPITPTKTYEYEWNDSSWVNLGEVSGSSRVPQGYTEVEYVQNTASGSNTSSTSRLSVKFEDSITNNESAYTYEVVAELNLGSQTTYFNLWGNNYVQIQRLDSGFGLKFNARAFGKTLSSASFLPSNDTKYRMKLYQGANDTYPQFEITDVTASTTSKYSLTNSWSGGGNTSTKLGLFHWYNFSDTGAKMTPAKIYEVIVTDREGNELCHSVPCKRDSDGKVGFYNLVRDEFEYDASGELTLIAGAETGGTEYPKYYSEKSEPLDNLTFNTLAEAQAYAYNNCVYDGMVAIIGGNRYEFDSTDENGWVEIG